MSFFSYLIFCLLVIYIKCQKDGSSTSDSDSNREERDSGMCINCCNPDHPFSYLALILGILFILGSILFITIVFHFCSKFMMFSGYVAYLAQLYPVKLSFTHDGTYRGLYYDYNLLWHSDSIQKVTFKIERNMIFATSIDNYGSYDWKGTIIKSQRIQIKKFYKDQPLKAVCEVNLVPFKLKDSVHPALVGPCFSYRPRRRAIWFLIPHTIEFKINEIIPFTYKSKLKHILFLMIILLSLSSIIHFSIRKPEFFYNIYKSYSIGIPYEALISCLGIFGLILFEKIFDSTLHLSGKLNEFLLYGLYCCLAVICMTFALININTADFLKSQNSLLTQGYNKGNSEYNLSQICKFSDYSCSTFWASPLENQDDTCKNEYFILCISYGSNISNMECNELKDHIFYYLLINSITGFILFIIWIFLVAFYIWIKRINYIKWQDIRNAMKLSDSDKEKTIFV